MKRLFRLTLPVSVCSTFLLLTFSGCNKETMEVDVQFVEATASRTFTTPITEISFGYSSDGMLVTSNRKKIYETGNYGTTWALCTTFTATSCFVDQVRYTNTGTLPYFIYHPSSGGLAQMYTSIIGNCSYNDQIISSGNTIVHSFYNSSSGYAYIKLPSNNYGLAQTTDFGQTYTYLYPSPVIGPFMQFTSSTTGYAITDQDNFSRTTNGGLTWTATFGTVKECTKVTPNGLCFLIGDDEKIRKSTDFGLTWTICLSDPGGNNYEAIACSDNGLVVVAAQGQLLCSRDFGATWKYLKFGTSSITLTRLLILSDGSVIGINGKTVSKYIIPETL